MKKNMVILYNQSDEEQVNLKYSKLTPVNSVGIKYEANKTNKELIEEYILLWKIMQNMMMIKLTKKNQGIKTGAQVA